MTRRLLAAPTSAWRACFLGLMLAAMLVPAVAGAQGTCEVNNSGSCTFGNTSAFAINVTVTEAVRLATSTTGIALATATGSNFDSGFGAGTLIGLNVRSNTTYTVSARATTALWGAVGVGARLDRPAADLQWATVLGGPYTNMTTSAVTVASGTATAGANSNLYMRARFTWVLDSPGDYSLTVQLTLTAP